MLREEGVHTEPLAVAGSAIDIAGFEKQLRPETVLVVLEAVSGETGERYDTLAVRRVLDAYHKKHAVRVRMHVDASQAPLELSFTLAHLGADLVSLDAQKVGGIRGCGVLLLRSGVTLTPLMRGGGQEQGLRPGTENPALATAFALALEECQNARAGFSERALKQRKEFCKKLEPISRLTYNEATIHVSHILNFSLLGRDTDYAVFLLNEEGFAVSTKSACETDEIGSRSVMAMTGDVERATTTLRISWGPETTEGDLAACAGALIRTVRFLDEKAI